jgi:hypothetical protein
MPGSGRNFIFIYFINILRDRVKGNAVKALIAFKNIHIHEELDSPAVSALGVRTWKLSNVRKGWVTKIYYLELLSASGGTISCWFRLHL